MEDLDRNTQIWTYNDREVKTGLVYPQSQTTPMIALPSKLQKAERGRGEVLGRLRGHLGISYLEAQYTGASITCLTGLCHRS